MDRALARVRSGMIRVAMVGQGNPCYLKHRPSMTHMWDVAHSVHTTLRFSSDLGAMDASERDSARIALGSIGRTVVLSHF